MEKRSDIVELAAVISARSAAYAEEDAAQKALSEAERRLRAAGRDVGLYIYFDDELREVMLQREASAKLRRDHAAERLREARRDLQRIRQLSDPEPVRAKDEYLD